MYRLQTGGMRPLVFGRGGNHGGIQDGVVLIRSYVKVPNIACLSDYLLLFILFVPNIPCLPTISLVYPPISLVCTQCPLFIPQYPCLTPISIRCPQYTLFISNIPCLPPISFVYPQYPLFIVHIRWYGHHLITDGGCVERTTWYPEL